MNTPAPKSPENKIQSAAQNDLASEGMATFRFQDNRSEQNTQVRLKELAKHSPVQTKMRTIQRMANQQRANTISNNLHNNTPSVQTHTLTSELKSQDLVVENPATIIQGNFKDRAIEKINRASEEDSEECALGTSTCGDAARIIYKVLQNGGDSAGTGTGINTLVAAMSDADKRVGQVFIYFVDADIVGHFFTILQSGTQAVIIQGYLEKITIAQNIAERGGAHNIWDTGQLKNDLKELVRLRDQIKDNFDNSPDEEGLVALGVVHTRLFGPGTDKEERRWIKRNILRKRGDDLTWKASFAEGKGPALNTAPPPAQGSKCFLTTACTQYFGLPDDCEELTTLRMFRDQYMSKLKDGSKMIQRYYEIAPDIVYAIQQLPDDKALPVWTTMYQNIRICVDAIKNGNPGLALRTYTSCVLELEEEFLEESTFLI